MKLKIKKYTNKNSKLNSFGKTYGRIQHLETLDTLDLAKHIQRHGSIYTRDVIVGVLEKFSLCIEELLQEGYKVKLDGLGTFYLAVKTTGESNADDFGLGNIKYVRIQFQADKSKDYDWSTTSQTNRSRFSFDSEEPSSGASASGSSSNSPTGNGSNTGGSSDSGSTSGGTTTGGDEPGEDRP